MYLGYGMTLWFDAFLRSQSLSVLAAKCLCEILKAHPHFNYRNNIITVLVPHMNKGNKEVGLEACSAEQVLGSTHQNLFCRYREFWRECPQAPTLLNSHLE